LSQIRQRPGVRLQSRLALAGRSQHRHRSHRPWQAVAERIKRILQWQVSRRVPEHAMVQEPYRCEDPDRAVPAGVQRDSASLESRAAHAAAIQTDLINNNRGSRVSEVTDGPKKAGGSDGPRPHPSWSEKAHWWSRPSSESVPACPLLFAPWT